MVRVRAGHQLLGCDSCKLDSLPCLRLDRGSLLSLEEACVRRVAHMGRSLLSLPWRDELIQERRIAAAVTGLQTMKIEELVGSVTENMRMV